MQARQRQRSRRGSGMLPPAGGPGGGGSIRSINLPTNYGSSAQQQFHSFIAGSTAQLPPRSCAAILAQQKSAKGTAGPKLRASQSEDMLASRPSTGGAVAMGRRPSVKILLPPS